MKVILNHRKDSPPLKARFTAHPDVSFMVPTRSKLLEQD